MSRCGVPSMPWRSNSRTIAELLCVCAILLSTVSPLTAQGKGRGVEVLAVSPKVIETAPGQIVSATFSVRSTTDQSEEFIEALTLPADWQAVIPPTSFVLDPQQTIVRLVAFLVPGNAASGSFQVTYSVRSRRDYGIQDSGTIALTVLPVTGLDLMLEGKPDAVIAGDTYQITFRAVNRSNTPLTVTLRASSSQKNPVKLDVESIHLAARGTRVVTATVSTSAKLKRRASDFISIRGTATDGKATISPGLSVSVDLVPVSGERADIYHRIPSQVRIASVGGSGKSAVQGELSGHGALDEAGMRTVDFLFRGPNIEDTSFYGLRDEYRMSYLTSDLDLRLGDQVFGLSPLTDYYRYGRGAGFDLRRKEIKSGAYYVEDRWESPDRREMGIYVGNESKNGLGVTVNLLTKTQEGPSGFHDDLLSLQGVAKPFPGANMELELGTCSSDRSEAADGQAYRLRLDGRTEDVYYSLGTIHASPDYFGYYNDADYSDLSLTFPISERLRGNAAGQRWRRNLDRDDSQENAPFERFYQVGLDYDLSASTRLSLDRLYFRRADQLDPASFNYEEHATRLGVSRSFATSSLLLYWDIGRQRDLLAGDSRSVSRYAVYYHLRAGANGYISLYTLFGDNGDRDSRLLGRDNTIGGSAYWKPSDRLSLSVTYATNRFRMDEDSDNRQLYATVVYRAADERIWSLRLRNSDRTVASETSLQLSYTIPFGIPVARKKNLGGMYGRVYDAENPEKPGIPRVIVTANGATAVTDEKGRFTFPTLTAGPCRVSIERNSIGLDRLTAARLPMVVEVAEGRTADVEIGVLRSARLRGKLSLLEFQTENSDKPGRTAIFVSAPGRSDGVISPDVKPVEVGGLGDVLLEFTRQDTPQTAGTGQEVLRLVTDRDGEFSLGDLRPGLWNVKVYDYNLPAFHYLEQPEFSIELEPGGEVSLPVSVLPRLRQIQMIEHDIISSQPLDQR